MRAQCTTIYAPFIRVERTPAGELEVEGLASAVTGSFSPPNREQVGDPFALWDWNGTSLHVENDRLGFSPMYYAATKEKIVVSPSLIRVLQKGATGEIDYRALGIFLRLGFFIGEDTPFCGVRALPPNVVATWFPDEGLALHRRAPVRPSGELNII